MPLICPIQKSSPLKLFDVYNLVHEKYSVTLLEFQHSIELEPLKHRQVQRDWRITNHLPYTKHTLARLSPPYCNLYSKRYVAYNQLFKIMLNLIESPLIFLFDF